MKKAQRIATASAALARVAAGVADPALIFVEIEKKVTGCITVDEAGKLVESKKWTLESVEHAKSLGLVVEKIAGVSEKPTGAGRVGNVAVQFAENNGELYNGKEPITPDGENLLKQWLAVYGLHASFKILRTMVREADKKFNLGIYFFPSEAGKKEAESPAAPQG